MCQSVPASWSSKPSYPSDFLACAIKLLRRGSSKCDQLVARLGPLDRVLAPLSNRPYSLEADWTQFTPSGTELPQEIRVLDLILGMDQKLEGLCGRSYRKACERGPRRPLSCRRAGGRAVERLQPTRFVSPSLPRLSQVKEEEHEHVDS